MNQDKRQGGPDFNKHQDQSANKDQGMNKPARPGEQQQTGQQPGGPQQGQRERDQGSSGHGQGGQGQGGQGQGGQRR